MDSHVRKISTKIWIPVIKNLEKKMDAACLRRDAYLNKVLETELDYLEEEVALSNSPAAQAFIADRLDQLNRKVVSLSLKKDVVDRLNDICTKKRIVRDAFFNRLFLILASSQKMVDHLLFRGVDEDWRNRLWSEHKHDEEFFERGIYPLDGAAAPFWAFRAGIDLYNKEVELRDHTNPETGNLIKVQFDLSGDVYLPDGIYTTSLGETELKNTDLSGLNCYLPDWKIPGTTAELKIRNTLDDLLGDLGGDHV